MRTGPRPPGAEKLGGDEEYRIGQRDDGMFCGIHDRRVTVETVRVGHRREI